MTIVVSDLVARVRAEGVEQATAAVKAYGDQAAVTARALQIMAEAATKQPGAGGSVQNWMEIFQKGNVQPTAAAMAQAATEMQKTAVAAQQAVQPVQNVAKAAADHAAAASNGARAAQAVADGWKLSESSVVRFGTALVGINLGISLIAGAARLIHDTVSGVVTAQLDWERSLVQVRALYGDIAPRVVALSQAQAALPGVTSSQQELLQANVAAGFLTTRYGISPSTTGTMTTQAARLGGLFNLSPEERAGLQGAFLSYARTGAGAGELEARTGQPFDPLTLARRLGFSSEAALQGLTPQQLIQARSQLEIATAAQTNIQGGTERRGLLDTQRELQHNLEQIRSNLQNRLEGALPQGFVDMSARQQQLTADIARAPTIAEDPLYQRQIAVEQQQVAQAAGDTQRMAALQDLQEAQDDIRANGAALAENRKQLEAANAALAKMGVEANSAAARLLSFTGSLEDANSIARGDVGAAAQAAVAARGMSAIPLIGRPGAEINFQAGNTAWAQAYQNYVALQAQSTTGNNPLRQWLEGRAAQEGPGGLAQRAIDSVRGTEPIQRQMGQAQTRAAQIDLATTETQSRMEEITLRQRERGVQLLRETVDLRRLDVQQQQLGLAATVEVVRAQQAGLPAQYRLADAQYQTNRASVLARARLAGTLQGKDVSGLPSIEDLIQMNVQGQFATAEAGPGALEAQRRIELAQRPATAIGLAQQLTAGQLRSEELKTDLANLGDLPEQTALELELVNHARDSLSVQREQRELLKALVYYMTQTRAPQLVPADRDDRIAAAGVALDALSDSLGSAASGQLAGARR